MPDAPAGIPDSYDEHVKLQFDLQALAFQGDMTRVFTMMMLHEGQDLAYPACGRAGRRPQPLPPWQRAGEYGTPGLGQQISQ